MNTTYDKYYQTKALFGEPYPELVAFFAEYPIKGKVLDLGCGQGRNAITLARLGYAVTGVDISEVGIKQMKEVSRAENLDILGKVGDIYAFDNFDEFDFVLLDSMFHFAKKDKEKEIGLIQKIIAKIKRACLVVICIQETGNKVQVLNQAIDCAIRLKRLSDKNFKYVFEDKQSGHKSETDYKMIIVEK